MLHQSGLSSCQGIINAFLVLDTCSLMHNEIGSLYDKILMPIYKALLTLWWHCFSCWTLTIQIITNLWYFPLQLWYLHVCTRCKWSHSFVPVVFFTLYHISFTIWKTQKLTRFQTLVCKPSAPTLGVLPAMHTSWHSTSQTATSGQYMIHPSTIPHLPTLPLLLAHFSLVQVFRVTHSNKDQQSESSIIYCQLSHTGKSIRQYSI